MVISLSAPLERCTALIDFGDVTNVSAIDIQTSLEKAVSVLSSLSLRNVSIAASSISALIGDMVSQQNSTAMVVRREINAWKSVKALQPRGNLVFGDYGVRNPDSLEDGPYPDVNGKIRYTCDGQFFVLRGHSMRQFSKGGQYDGLARALVESPYYMGKDFSWGDHCAHDNPAHSPGAWVGYDTNHHIEAVVMELMEFKQSVVSSDIFAR
ncbi:MAG: beta family protein [Pseudomonadota bacterium]